MPEQEICPSAACLLQSSYDSVASLGPAAPPSSMLPWSGVINPIVQVSLGVECKSLQFQGPSFLTTGLT